MKKLLSLTFIGLLSILQTAQADISNLEQLPQQAGESQLDKTSLIIQSIGKNKPIILEDGTERRLHIDAEELATFTVIKASLNEFNNKTIKAALRNNDLTLTQDGIRFSLADNQGNTAAFLMGTAKQIEAELAAQPKDLSTFSGEILECIASHLSLKDAHSLGLTNMQMKQVCLDTSPLTETLNRQFFDAIQALYEIVPSETPGEFDIGIKDIDQETTDFHIRRLMEVLRLLHDHARFEINEDAYQSAVINLEIKEQKLWKDDLVYALYDMLEEDPFSNRTGFDVIRILIGQILNHMDEEERTFEIKHLDSGSVSEINAKAELLFHINSIVPTASGKVTSAEFRWAMPNASNLKLLNFITNQYDKLTKRTLEQIQSFAERPRKHLYRVPDPIILYALQNSNEENPFLEDLLQSKSDNFAEYLKSPVIDHKLAANTLKLMERSIHVHGTNAYMNYLERSDTNPETVKDILKFAKERSNRHTAKIYSAYIRNTTADPAVVVAILRDTEELNPSDKSNIYTSYLGRANIDPGVMKTIFKHAKKQNFNPTVESIYIAYLRRNDTDPAITNAIFKITKELSDETKKTLFTTYLERINVDPLLVNTIIESAKQSDDCHYKEELYGAYLRHIDVAPNIASTIIEDIKNCSNYSKGNTYRNYFKRINADPIVMAMIIEDAKQSEDNAYKVKIYAMYLKRADTDIAVARTFYEDAKQSDDNRYTLDIYSLYLKYEGTDLATTTEIFEDIKKFDGDEKSDLYTTYIRSTNIDPTIMAMIFEDVKYFTNYDKKYIYTTYFERIDVDPTLVKEIFKQTKKLDIYQKEDIYKAYLKRDDVDSEVLEIILAEFRMCSRDSYLYKDYFARKEVNSDVVETFFKYAEKECRRHDREAIYDLYLRRADADQALVEASKQRISAKAAQPNKQKARSILPGSYPSSWSRSSRPPNRTRR